MTCMADKHMICATPQLYVSNTWLLEVLFASGQWKNVQVSDQLVRFASSLCEESLNNYKRTTPKALRNKSVSNCEYLKL